MPVLIINFRQDIYLSSADLDPLGMVFRRWIAFSLLRQIK